MSDLSNRIKLLEEFTGLSVNIEEISCKSDKRFGCDIIDENTFLIYNLSDMRLVIGPFILSSSNLTGTDNASLTTITEHRLDAIIKLCDILFTDYSYESSELPFFFSTVEKAIAQRRAAQLPAYDYEAIKQYLADAMFSGPDKILVDYMHHVFEYNIPDVISSDPVHTRRILSFTFLSMLTKTAIEAGMDVIEAFVINDLYLSFLDKASDIKQMDKHLFSAICTFSSKMRKSKAVKCGRYVSHCIAIITNNLSQPLKLKDMALDLGISPEYLSRQFVIETGKTFTEYLKAFRMAEAERLLKYTNETCANIAFLTGFSSCAHFCKEYKKYRGVSPGRTRSI